MTGKQPKAGAWGAWRARIYALSHRDSPSNAWIVEQANLEPSDRVLDIGCGPGVAVGMAARKTAIAVGIDPTPGLIAVARRRNRSATNAEFHLGSADDLPFSDGEFTVVWAIASLHHWPAQPTTFEEIHRVLSPGGRLLLAEWRIDSLHGHGLNEEGAGEVVSQLERIGFQATHTDMVNVGRNTMIVIRAART